MDAHLRRFWSIPSLLLVLAALGLSPAQGQIPTPESVLGFKPGADFRLADYEQALEYFQRLEEASDRVQLREVGRTTNGRPWYVALISSAENLANIDRYQEISLRLAHPKGLTEAEARALAREGKAIVHVDGGLHSTEVAHSQHTIQLAYDLVTGDADPEIAAILDNVILLLWFSMNPEGQTMVADWYRANLGTPFEVAPMPWLYQEYVGHDNNRDGYMINMIESRVVTRVTREWEPQILYNHHQTAPFPARIWIPPFAEPISPHVHPLMWRTVNLVGMAMAQALEERGQKGAVHMGTGFDNWYPGFIDHAHNFHNVAAFLTETGLYRYATPHFYTVDDFPDGSEDLLPQSLYASPWEGGWWRLGDAVDYMITASLSVLDVAAKYKEDVLYNRYQAGRDVIQTYTQDPPYAFFIPREQVDPVAPVELLRRLAFNGIDIHTLSQDLTFEGVLHRAGSWVILMDQEYGNFVRQLFDVQEYPDLREYPEGPPDQPYDVSGWTLPFQMGVKVVEARSPLGPEVRAKLTPVQGDPVPWDADVEDSSPFDSPPGVGFDANPVAAGIVPPPGEVRGSGSRLALDPAQNNAFKALNRAWDSGARVEFEAGAPGSEGVEGESGRYLVSGLGSSGLQSMVSDYHLVAERTGGSGVELSRPRLGLYRPWNASMDEGWTRWLLESYGFDVVSLYNADVLAGELRGRFDVIILADISSRQITEGFEAGSVPARYAGGIGRQGTMALDEFVRAGGTLVCINRSSAFAMDEFHLPVRNVVADLERSEFSLSGAIVELEMDRSHPVMAGMPERSKVMVGGSPVFTVEEGFEGRALAKYPAAGSPLLSGYLLGEEFLRGYAAALDVAHGEGRVVLLGMRPQWRGQPFGNLRILFNAALYSADVAGSVPRNEEFWTPPAEPDSDEKGAEGRNPADPAR